MMIRSSEGSADDAIASSAIESYKTQNLFGSVFRGPVGGPGKFIKIGGPQVDPTQKQFCVEGPGACTIKLYGLLFYGKGEKLRRNF